MGELLSYTAEEVDRCAFDHWYPLLKDVSIKGHSINLPTAFITYLLADGIQLPQDYLKSGDVNIRIQEAIQTVQAQVETNMKLLGQKCFIKLNWSAPRDAKWMLNTLKCTSFDDIVLLLKSSDFILHDLLYPYQDNASEEDGNRNEAPVLVMKKWCNLHESMLFRCFVIGKRLRKISQRNCETFYPFLALRRDRLQALISDFFTTHLAPLSGRLDGLNASYAFDVYVDKKERVFLVDVNVFGQQTDSCLFTWPALVHAHEQVEFRVIEEDQAIQPDKMTNYRAPTDLMQVLSMENGFDAFLAQVKKDNEPEDS